MLISGIHNTTLLDYPGKVAATVFTGGCNFRCPFCHNGGLVINAESIMTDAELMKFLRKRKGVLDAVCITGGEPTLQKDLMEILCRIKSLGYSIKLDTNGYNPGVLRNVIDGHLVDYVAMDIKAAPYNYSNATGIKYVDISLIKESAECIMQSGINYEFRTTLVKGIHCKDEMQGISELINGATAYYLQSYKNNDNEIHRISGMNMEYLSFNKEELEEYLNEAKTFSEAYLRGID